MEKEAAAPRNIGSQKNRLSTPLSRHCRVVQAPLEDRQVRGKKKNPIGVFNSPMRASILTKVTGPRAKRSEFEGQRFFKTIR